MYLRDGSVRTIVRAATLRQKLQTKLAISPNSSVLTLGQPVPTPTPHCKRLAGQPVEKHLSVTSMTRHGEGEGEPLGKVRIEPRSTAVEVDP